MTKNFNKIFIAAVLVFFIASCAKEVSEKDKVKLVIDEVATSIQNKDMKKVMKHFSEDYKDDRGNDRRAIKSFIFMQVMRKGELSVFVRSTDISIDEDGRKALAMVDAILAEGINTDTLSDILPEKSSGYKFTLLFDKVDGDWLINNATWENVGAKALF